MSEQLTWNEHQKRCKEFGVRKSDVQISWNLYKGCRNERGISKEQFLSDLRSCALAGRPISGMYSLEDRVEKSSNSVASAIGSRLWSFSQSRKEGKENIEERYVNACAFRNTGQAHECSCELVS